MMKLMLLVPNHNACSRVLSAVKSSLVKPLSTLSLVASC